MRKPSRRIGRAVLQKSLESRRRTGTMLKMMRAECGPSRAPDVVLVVTTQWRSSAFSWLGDPNARTPRLDGLSGEGVWFGQAVTPHPFGVFARAALLTGRRCPANGVRDYYDPLPAGAPTLAHAFGERGYDTAFFGKWQLYERDPSAPVVGEEHARVVVPESRRGGFGHWEGFESGFLLNDPLLHGTSIGSPRRFEGYQSDVLVQRFNRYAASRSDDRPLFAVVSMDAPHPPYAAPASGVKSQDPALIWLLAGTTHEPELRAKARQELAGYYAHIEATDRAIGRLMDGLKERGSWSRTVFVFTSTHGDMHGVDGKFRKGWPHEESVRVPLCLVWPGRLPARRDDQLLISLLDLGPSLIGMALNLDAKQIAACGFHGHNLAGAIAGRGPGPHSQILSMPSVPPFPLQCPYPWTAQRDHQRTRVVPESGDPYELEHSLAPRFEP